MIQPHYGSNREQVVDTMIELTRLSKLHRAIVAGSDRLELYLALRRRGFIRVATAGTCRIPRGQHAVGLITGQNSLRAIEAALAEISQFLCTSAAIVVGETAGEASTLTPVEHDAIVCTAIEIARGRVRIIAGAGSNSTSQAIELTRRAEAAGADGVLSVVPYYNKPMQAGIYAHFRAIAGSTTLPIIVHDVPSRTIRELADDTLARLSESRQFIGLKDGTGDITRPLRLRPLLPPGFRLLSGDDTTALAFLANGWDGCISTISNVAPELCQVIFSSSR